MSVRVHVLHVLVSPLTHLSDFSLMPQGLHTQAAQCQWALVMFFLLFIGTFAIEFRHSRFSAVCTDDSGTPVNLTLSEVSRYQPEEM